MESEFLRHFSDKLHRFVGENCKVYDSVSKSFFDEQTQIYKAQPFVLPVGGLWKAQLEKTLGSDKEKLLSRFVALIGDETAAPAQLKYHKLSVERSRSFDGQQNQAEAEEHETNCSHCLECAKIIHSFKLPVHPPICDIPIQPSSINNSTQSSNCNIPKQSSNNNNSSQPSNCNSSIQPVNINKSIKLSNSNLPTQLSDCNKPNPPSISFKRQKMDPLHTSSTAPTETTESILRCKAVQLDSRKHHCQVSTTAGNEGSVSVDSIHVDFASDSWRATSRHPEQGEPWTVPCLSASEITAVKDSPKEINVSQDGTSVYQQSCVGNKTEWCPCPQTPAPIRLMKVREFAEELERCDVEEGELLYWQWRGLPSPPGQPGDYSEVLSEDQDVDADEDNDHDQEEEAEGYEEGKKEGCRWRSLPSGLRRFLSGVINAAICPDFIDPQKVRQRNLWWGSSLTSRLHFDAMDNLYVVLSGQKTFHLYAPWDRSIAPQPWQEGELNNKARLGSIFSAPCGSLRPQVAHLTQFQALFIPSGWWHEVFTIHGPCIAVNAFLTPCSTSRLRPTILSQASRKFSEWKDTYKSEHVTNQLDK